jgi:MFS family permease
MGLAINVVVMAGMMRDVPPGMVGAASGRVAVGLYLGFAAGPLAMGGLLTAFNGFMAGWCVVVGLYLACALLAALARHRMPGRPRRRSPAMLDRADAPQGVP